MVSAISADVLWPETPRSPNVSYVGKGAFKTSLGIAWSNFLGYLFVEDASCPPPQLTGTRDPS